jgi:hypothetical protein
MKRLRSELPAVRIAPEEPRIAKLDLTIYPLNSGPAYAANARTMLL